jgi:hypothetical protein
MQAFQRLTIAVVALAAALSSYGLPAQEVRHLRVPKVRVTAPSLVPPYLRPTPVDWLGARAYERNPYFGSNRVEENNFPPVPCDGFRIDPAAAGTSGRTCLQGYRLVPGYLSGTDRDSGNNCEIDHDVAIYNVGDLSVEADVFVFDPYKLTATGPLPSDCYVAGYNSYDQEDFEDMNQITRQGTDWHDFRGESCYWADRSAACETKSIEFSYGAHKCIGIRRPGPRWSAGYVWELTASICRSGTASLEADDVARALAPLQIRPYDPNGNIARPPG